jgi:hypothetical protein
VSAAGDESAAVDHHIGHVAGIGAEHNVLDRRSSARGADRIDIDRDEVGARSDGEPPGVRRAVESLAKFMTTGGRAVTV